MEHVNKKSFFKLCILILIAFIIKLSSAVEFDYKNVDSWVQINPQCGGQRQSPIRLDESDMDENDIEQFSVINYDKIPRSAKMMNDGHTLKVSFEWEDDETPFLTGGIFGDTKYILDSLHFHWSRTSAEGSEHVIYGKPAPLESHFVHYNLDYGSVANALNYDDGLTVVGAQFELLQQKRRRQSRWGVFQPSPVLASILSNITAVSTPGSSCDIVPFAMKDFRPVQVEESDYFGYLGSLTTPPCTENVLWLLSTYPYQIANSQLQYLQSTIEFNHGDDHNNRDVQPKNNRQFSLILGTPKFTN